MKILSTNLKRFLLSTNSLLFSSAANRKKIVILTIISLLLACFELFSSLFLVKVVRDLFMSNPNSIDIIILLLLMALRYSTDSFKKYLSSRFAYKWQTNTSISLLNSQLLEGLRDESIFLNTSAVCHLAAERFILPFLEVLSDTFYLLCLLVFILYFKPILFLVVITTTFLISSLILTSISAAGKRASSSSKSLFSEAKRELMLSVNTYDTYFISSPLSNIWIQKYLKSLTSYASTLSLYRLYDQFTRFGVEISLILSALLYLAVPNSTFDPAKDALVLIILFKLLSALIKYTNNLKTLSYSKQYAYNYLSIAKNKVKIIPTSLPEQNTPQLRMLAHFDLTNKNLSIDIKSIISGDHYLSFKSINHLCIIGKSGIGKSRLLSQILGLNNCESYFALGLSYSNHENRVIDVKNVDSIPANIFYIPQKPIFEPISLEEFFSLPYLETSTLNYSKIDQILTSLDLGYFTQNLSSTYISSDSHTLSLGELKRLYLARAIYCNCQILFADELFSGLDPSSIAKSMKIIADHDLIFISVSHSPDEVRIADEVLDLSIYIQK